MIVVFYPQKPRDSIRKSLIIMGNNKKSFYGNKLMDWLREVCIVETEDQMYYDARETDKEGVEIFINNIKAQNGESENNILENLTFETAKDFIAYLEDEDRDDCIYLASKIINAAYCTWRGIKINDNTELFIDEKTYYINDDMDVHYELETDIDISKKNCGNVDMSAIDDLYKMLSDFK